MANRQYPETSGMIGFFVNTLALRQKIDGAQKVSEYIRAIGEMTAEAQKYQDVPFEELVEKLRVEKDPSRSPIFQALFSIQDFGQGDEDARSIFEDTHGLGENDYYKVAKFDLSLLLKETGERIEGTFNYAVSLFERGTIERYIETYRVLVKAMVGKTGGRVGELPVLPEEGYRRIVYEWNRTEAEYPADKTAAELFEEQTERTPGRTAVVYGSARLTYRELNERANKLARYLTGKYGIGPDDLVALCLDRSEYMLIAILGILKAGGAYVPIAPDYPDERIGYILEDTGAKAVLAGEIYRERLATLFGDNRGLESIDTAAFWETLEGEAETNPQRKTGPRNLAYVIYTSGTTGQPKGVMLEHRGLVNRIFWMNSEYPLRETDRILQKTAYTFDVSVWELTWAIFYGARIVFAQPEGHKDSVYLAELIEREQITVIHFVPSMLSVFEETVGGDERLRGSCESLRYIFCSGEALTLQQVKESQRLFGGAEIHNLYGPTEASIDVLYYDCNDRDIQEVLIGKPIYNTTMYILDDEKKPVPVGAAGELYIGGVGVARGYLNKPELTAEKFIANPYQSEEEKARGYNGMLYRTGDLVRYMPDGNIEYLGRNDFQVKIRGFRIELGEIESRLLEYKGIKQAVVVARERGGEKYLTAYYTGEGELDESGLRAHIEGRLPEYMVPAAYVRLEEMPVTVNGKLDRGALPESEIQDTERYEGPADEMERRLCGIYGEILGIDTGSVSVWGDFFRLGGNSIMAIKLANRIQKESGEGIQVADIFKYRTVRKLAEAIAGGVGRGIKIAPVRFRKVEEQVLSYAQGRLWFLENYEGGSNAYNISVVEGLRSEVDIESLKEAIKGVVRRHEVLRSVIKTEESGEAYQEGIDWEEEPFEIEEEEAGSEDRLAKGIREEANHIFLLDREYPIRVKVYREGGGEIPEHRSASYSV
jgi:amino acid adenylation domain-containing protein